MDKIISSKGKEIKRKYMNDEERNIYVVLSSIANELNGEFVRKDSKVETLKSLAEKWEDNNFITKEERKNLKSAASFLNKFLNSVYARMDKKTQEMLIKKFMSAEFKINDVYFENLIKRYFKERNEHVVLSYETIDAVVEDLAAVYCVKCNHNYQKCPIYELYDKCGYQKLGEKDNCPFAADLNDLETKEDIDKVLKLQELVRNKNKISSKKKSNVKKEVNYEKRRSSVNNKMHRVR